MTWQDSAQSVTRQLQAAQEYHFLRYPDTIIRNFLSGFMEYSAQMKYRFSVFTLDTASKEVSTSTSRLKLSRQGFDMLLLLVENPGQVFSKEDLVREVWKGRQVTNNSVDQCISKLRKALADIEPGNYIETVYGKGLKFAPDVVKEGHARGTGKTSLPKNAVAESGEPSPGYKQRSRLSKAVVLLLIGFVVIIAVTWTSKHKSSSPNEAEPLQPLLLINDNTTSTDWSIAPYFDHVISYANAAQVKTPETEIVNEEKQLYLERQWRISPELQVISSRLEEKNGTYLVTLTVSSRAQEDVDQQFSGKEFSSVIKTASRWLAEQLHQSKRLADVQPLIPGNSYLLELYMRGLSAAKAGKINKAAHFFRLCLEDKPDFHLARVELADAISKQGKPQEALALLDTLPDMDAYPQVDVNIASIRGDILDTRGKYQEARNLYQKILDKYAQTTNVNLDEVRYNFSYTLTSLEEYDQALQQLNTLENKLSENTNPELLAHVYQKIGSIQQNLGQLQQAAENANRALELLSRLEDLPGKAKILTLLARISNHQAQYRKATQYLQQALQISRSLDYKLGMGATLNELIYALMVQGYFHKASMLNQQMQDIALEIDHTNMLLASKQLAADIARSQNQWVTARVALDDHLALAKSVNNERAQLKNKLLSLDFYLDQKQPDPVLPIIEDIQRHIEKSKETRLLPRLKRQLARYYLLKGNTRKALSLLKTARKTAIATNDGETLTETGNLLAEYYIDQKQGKQALVILAELDRQQPLPHPYLLLKSKALALEGKNMAALEAANLCKQKSNEWWTADDEKYLTHLRSINAQSL
jgi:DNA-binding winged helix-turn-helix (wHTH) protein/tetratricopeptide (TPR) repeat protein